MLEICMTPARACIGVIPSYSALPMDTVSEREAAAPPKRLDKELKLLLTLVRKPRQALTTLTIKTTFCIFPLQDSAAALRSDMFKADFRLSLPKS